MTAPIFKVTHNGEEVEYSGMWAKYIETAETDMYIAAGESMMTTINIADYYILGEDGVYEVS